MTIARLDTELLERLREVVEAAFGLQYNQDRLGDLERGILAAAKSLEAGSPREFAQSLANGTIPPRVMDALAHALTIGETYFFRDEALFEILTEKFLPDLIRKRREAGLPILRIWSAGCCTGEEPYSLAMVLSGLLPDIDQWNISILGTDLNPAFLDRARQGVFGEWSMRVLPPALRGIYFLPAGNKRYRIKPEIQKRVKFSRLNLAREIQPDSMAHLQSMDLILCRNVLMYMSADRAEKILAMFGTCLSDAGLIALAPVETTLARNLPLRPGAYGHSCLLDRGEPAVQPVSRVDPSPMPASAIQAQRQVDDAVNQEIDGTSPRPLLRKAQEFADHGRLEEALSAAAMAYEATGEAEAGYLVATILREMGRDEEAIRNLEDLVAAHQDFILAHFTLGTLLQKGQRKDIARGHFQEALRLLERREPAAVLPGTSGELTAGRMLRLVSSLLEGTAGP